MSRSPSFRVRRAAQLPFVALAQKPRKIVVGYDETDIFCNRKRGEFFGVIEVIFGE